MSHTVTVLSFLTDERKDFILVFQPKHPQKYKVMQTHVRKKGEKKGERERNWNYISDLELLTGVDGTKGALVNCILLVYSLRGFLVV